MDLIIFPECALTGYPPRDIAVSGRINVNVVSEAEEKTDPRTGEKYVVVNTKKFNVRLKIWIL